MNFVKNSRVICVMGPTASGKTDLALTIADEFPCDLISVDSVMIYRGLDIGSAKPSSEVLQKYPHQLIDIINPEESYSVANFCENALYFIKKSHSKNRIPLLVGGTMLYFNALLHGLSDMPSANEEVRKEITERANEKGWDYVHAQLVEVDPQAAARIHPNDPQRIQRAMEVYELTGRPLSEWHSEAKAVQFPYEVLKLALIPNDRAVLHEQIERRFDQMMQAGFMEETQQLYERKSLHADLPSMRSVGYRQAWKYFAGEYDAETMKEKAIIATRQFAKRQLTWLRSEADLVTISAEKPDIHDIRQEISRFLA